MAYESRRAFDIDHNRSDGEHRDSERGPKRHDTSWDKNGQYNMERRGPERSHTWSRSRDHGANTQRERSELSSPSTSSSVRNDTTTELFPGKQASCSTSKHQSSAVPPGAQLPPTIKWILDLLGGRMIWYMNRDQAEKDRQKNQSAYDRCRQRPSDFGSVVDLVAQQKKSAEDEVNKTEKRIRESDEKITAALFSLIQLLKQDSTDQATPANVSTDQAGIDERRIAVRTSLKHDLAGTLTKETENTKHTLKKLYESRASELSDSLTSKVSEIRDSQTSQASELRGYMISQVSELRDSMTSQVSELKDSMTSQVSELKVSLAKESIKRAVLEERLAKETSSRTALEKKFSVLEQRFDRLNDTETRATKGPEPVTNDMPSVKEMPELVKQQSERIDYLGSRVVCMEESLAEIQRLVKQADDHSLTITKHAEKQRESDTVLASLRSTVSQLLPSQTLENMAEELSNLKQQIQSARASHSHMAALDDRILQIVKPELEKGNKSMKNAIEGILSKLQPFLEKERNKRAAMEEGFSDATSQISKLRKDVDVIKSEHTQYIKLSDQSRKHAEDLTYLGQRTMLIDTRLDGLTRDNRAEFDGLHVQIQNISGWQNNFDTRLLYKDIVNHVNATMPDGVMKQIRVLSQKVEGVETRLLACEDGATKRRKLPNGNFAAVNA